MAFTLKSQSAWHRATMLQTTPAITSSFVFFMTSQNLYIMSLAE
ncbi:MAG: hypothetical protein ACTSRT_16655 [Promethearchaeota archaeon]